MKLFDTRSEYYEGKTGKTVATGLPMFLRMD